MEPNERQFDEELLYVSNKISDLNEVMPPNRITDLESARALTKGYYKALKDGKAHLLHVTKGVTKKNFALDYGFSQPIENLPAYRFDRIEQLKDRRFSNIRLRFTFAHEGDQFEIDFVDLRLSTRFFNFVKRILFKRL